MKNLRFWLVGMKKIPHEQIGWLVVLSTLEIRQIRIHAQDDDDNSTLLERLMRRPEGISLIRRDRKDDAAIQNTILQKYQELQLLHKPLGSDDRRYLCAFAEGSWNSLKSMNGLILSEVKPENENFPMNPDHWFELNTTNGILFSSLCLVNQPDLLPGRLFTTRMPRDITNPATLQQFREKAVSNNLHSVYVLTEKFEYDKYARSNLEDFYNSLNLTIICRPIPDFDIPKSRELIQDIKDITFDLAEGRNVLVHCAGGTGRTGMVICSVFRNLGVHDPIAWCRRVKSTYVETQAQEDFINTVPLVLDTRICTSHPALARAIAGKHLLAALYHAHANSDLITPPVPIPVPVHSHVTMTSLVKQLSVELSLHHGYLAAFQILDTDRSGLLSIAEIKELAVFLSAEFNVDDFVGKLQQYSLDNDVSTLSPEEFVLMMKENVRPSLRHY